MCTGERYWTINIFVQELEVTEEDMIRFFTTVHSEDNFTTKVIVPNIAYLPKIHSLKIPDILETIVVFNPKPGN